MPASSSTMKMNDTARRGLRSLAVAGVFLVAVAFIPWQQRDFEIRVKDPIPMSFHNRAELQRDIADAKSGTFSVRGYDVHKSTPFGDGILVGALGGVIAATAVIVLATRRHLKPALLAIAGGSLVALVVSLNDNFTYQPGVDWSSRDWNIWWAGDNQVRMQTEPLFGMFLVFVISAYLTWRSVSIIRRLSGHGSNVVPSAPGADKAWA